MGFSGLALVALFACFIYQQKQHDKRRIAELAGILSALRRISAALDLGVSALAQRPAERPAPVSTASQAREGDRPPIERPAERPAQTATASEARESDRTSIEEPTQLMNRGELAAVAAELEPTDPSATKLELEPAQPSQKPPPPSLAPVTPTRLSSQSQRSAASSLAASSPHPRAT